MRANKSHSDEAGGGPRDHGGRLELFFYEQRGNRYYLRLTRLAVILIAGLTAVSIAAIVIIFLAGSSQNYLENVNINMAAPPGTPLSVNKPLIKQAPPPSPPKVIRPQPVVIPTPSATPTPERNVNVRPEAAPTPRRDASKPPP
jgi:hypothetical protein